MNARLNRLAFALLVGATTLAAGILGLEGSATARVHAAVHPETCRFARSDGRRGWTAHEIERTIRCAVDRWPVYGGASKAIDVARCESGLNERAVSASGTYRGVYQQSITYWPGRYRAYSPDRFALRSPVLNGRTNVVVSIRQAHVGGWGPWSCA